MSNYEAEAEEMAKFSFRMEKHNNGRKGRLEYVKTLSPEDFHRFFIYREQQYLCTALCEERCMAEIDDLGVEVDKLKADLSKSWLAVSTANSENEELKAENEKLKSDKGDLRKVYSRLKSEIIEACGFDDDTSAQDLVAWVSDMADEHDPELAGVCCELKAEAEKAWDLVRHTAKLHKDLEADLGVGIDKLEAENKKLEKEVSLINSEEMENEEEIARLQEEIDKLEAENKKLKGGISNLNQVHQDEIVYVNAKCQKLKSELEDASSREDSMFQTLNKKRKEESDWAMKKIDKLEAENKKLKEEDFGDDEPRCDFCNRTHDEVMYEDNEEDAWDGDTGCCKKCQAKAANQ